MPEIAGVCKCAAAPDGSCVQERGAPFCNLIHVGIMSAAFCVSAGEKALLTEGRPTTTTTGYHPQDHAIPKAVGGRTPDGTHVEPGS